MSQEWDEESRRIRSQDPRDRNARTGRVNSLPFFLPVLSFSVFLMPSFPDLSPVQPLFFHEDLVSLVCWVRRGQEDDPFKNFTTISCCDSSGCLVFCWFLPYLNPCASFSSSSFSWNCNLFFFSMMMLCSFRCSFCCARFSISSVGFSLLPVSLFYFFCCRLLLLPLFSFLPGLSSFLVWLLLLLLLLLLLILLYPSSITRFCSESSFDDDGITTTAFLLDSSFLVPLFRLCFLNLLTFFLSSSSSSFTGKKKDRLKVKIDSCSRICTFLLVLLDSKMMWFVHRQKKDPDPEVIVSNVRETQSNLFTWLGKSW